jgi:hypothetical protein
MGLVISAHGKNIQAIVEVSDDSAIYDDLDTTVANIIEEIRDSIRRIEESDEIPDDFTVVGDNLDSVRSAIGDIGDYPDIGSGDVDTGK